MSGGGADIPGSGQLRLDFPVPTLGFDELVVTPCNAGAFRVIRRPTNWPMTALCLLGDPESGRTTAAVAWAREVGGDYVTAATLNAMTHAKVEALSKTNTVIDDADQIGNFDHLLSLINLSERARTRVLLTATTPPKSWRTKNPDLVSRLKAMPIAQIDKPDEEMLIARLQASCRREYIKLTPDVTRFLSTRLGLSYAGLEDYVRRLTDAIVETGRAPTVPLARSVLEQGTGSRALFEDEG